MNKEKITEKLDEAGHKVDNWVETKSAKHGFTKPQVWIGLGIAALALVGAAKLFGLL